MERKVILVTGIFLVVLAGASGVYRAATGRWPGEKAVESRLAEQEYEKHVKEDVLDFGQTPLATEKERQAIIGDLLLSKSFYSTHQQGSYGMIHAVVEKGKDIVPLKARGEDGYFRLSPEDDWSCLTFGNKPPGWELYKSGQANVYSGGVTGMWWGDSEPIIVDMIVMINGRRVVLKDISVTGRCGSMVE